jgi:hypothetical protein
MLCCLALGSLAVGSQAQAASIRFLTDPFAGSTALETPGRQVVGGEPFGSFNTDSDVFAFAREAFDVGDELSFANDVVANLPAGGVNVIVLRTFDDDGNPATPFNAGSAANLIAAQLTSPGAGFFVYFNQGLDLPRLVYSTNLDDNTADLKILFRMTNLVGDAGRDALAGFAAGNFVLVAEPSSGAVALLFGLGLWVLAVRASRRGRRGA